MRKDGCNCCYMCARQQGDLCDRMEVCDENKGLYCDMAQRIHGKGICRGKCLILKGVLKMYNMNPGQIKGLYCGMEQRIHDKGMCIGSVYLPSIRFFDIVLGIKNVFDVDFLVCIKKKRKKKRF